MSKKESMQNSLMEKLRKKRSYANLNINLVYSLKKKVGQLREKEQELEAVFDSTTDVIIVLDRKGVIRNVNSASKKTSGYSPEDLIGKSISELEMVDEKNKKKLLDGFEKRIRGVSPEAYDIEVTSKNNVLKIFEVRAAPLKRRGDITGTVSIFEDITQRRKAEQRLKQSEKKYRTLVEHTGTAIAILEDDMTISFINNTFERLSGYSKQEVIGKRWTRFVSKKDIETMKKYHSQRRKDPKKPPKQYTFEFITKKGGVRTVKIFIDLIPGTKRSVTSLIDITDLKRYQKTLEKSQERYRKTVEATSNVIYSLSPELKFTFVSENIRRYGFSPEDFYRDKNMKIKMIHPEDRKEQEKRLADFKNSRKRKLRRIYRIKKGKAAFWVQDILVRFSAGKEASRFCGSLADITEQKKAELKCEEIKKRYKKKIAKLEKKIKRSEKEKSRERR